MTSKEFLQQLESIAPHYNWEYGPLRGHDQVGKIYCPITAVYKSTTGNYHPASCWGLAARELGLPKRSALNIVRAADELTKSTEKLLKIISGRERGA